MLGILFALLFSILGLYLTGSALWRKLRCRTFLTATVAMGCNQDTLSSKGTSRKNRFPQYHFSLNGSSYLVTDYNASRGTPLRTGDIVHIFCNAAKPDRCWYAVGGLWKDTLWGLLSLVLAAGTIFLFFL